MSTRPDDVPGILRDFVERIDQFFGQTVTHFFSPERAAIEGPPQ